MNHSFSPARKHLRVGWRQEVRVETLTGGETYTATTFNISAGGLCLLPNRSIPVGRRVVVQIQVPDGLRQRVLCLRAQVVRDVKCEREGDLIGLVFDELSLHQRNFLRDFVLRRALARLQSIAEYQAFRSLSDLDLLELASVSHELKLASGQHAARFGEEATSVFLVKSGAVELRTPELDEIDVQVEVARAGQVFGEAAALLKLPHNLDVVALEDTEVLVIPFAALSFLREHSPRVALVLYEIFAAFMGRRVRQLTGRLVSPLSY